jgi:NO-binding membrane sensor protein with MHYT domain
MPRQQEASFVSKCIWTAVAAGAVGYAIWEVRFIFFYFKDFKPKNQKYVLVV